MARVFVDVGTCLAVIWYQLLSLLAFMSWHIMSLWYQTIVLCSLGPDSFIAATTYDLPRLVSPGPQTYWMLSEVTWFTGLVSLVCLSAHLRYMAWQIFGTQVVKKEVLVVDQFLGILQRTNYCKDVCCWVMSYTNPWQTLKHTTPKPQKPHMCITV
jgi:hypothetical protein